MQYFSAVRLSENAVPILVESEVVRLMQDGVAIYEPSSSLLSRRVKVTGLLQLTTHRLLWVQTSGEGAKSQPEGLSLPLAKIHSTDWKAGLPPFTHDKILVFLSDTGQSKASSVNISFRMGSVSSKFLEKLNDSLTEGCWKRMKMSNNALEKSKAEFRTSQAGVIGLMRDQDMKHLQTEKTLEQAFTDLSGLMDRAKDVVGLAERLSAAMQKRQTGDGDDTENATELRSMLLSMGISNPVTRETTGSNYHMQLARQLAEFLEPRVKQAGGMMTLPDVYCLVNRARGTELLSPDDLFTAATLFDTMQLSLRLRRFESGVIVVQTRDHTDDVFVNHLLKLCQKEKYLTVSDLARLNSLTLSVAQEQLTIAEKNSALCRDETLSGIRYYPNFFLNPEYLDDYFKADAVEMII